jgi:hypothetical protein
MTDGDDQFKDAPASSDFELPVAPAWFSQPPVGTMEDGVMLSVEAWRAVESRASAIFAERDKHRCDVEFKL